MAHTPNPPCIAYLFITIVVENVLDVRTFTVYLLTIRSGPIEGHGNK
jgi:hypothetical protein